MDSDEDMNSKELVKAALSYNYPDRLPRDLWGERILSLKRSSDWEKVQALYPMDFARAPVLTGQSQKTKGLPWQEGGRVDEWGNKWISLEEGLSGEVVKPALLKFKNFNSFESPFEVFENPNFNEVITFCKHNEEKYILGETGPGPFERIQSLLGTEDTFYSFAVNEPKLLELIKLVHKWNIRHIETWCKTDIDGITMGDDWGSQTSMLISPQLWRYLFKPLYADYCSIIHSHRKNFFFHSDGNILEIISDLVDIKIDALNCQLFCMNMEEIALQFKGKITFWGEIDRQNILPFGTPDDVKKAARKFKNTLYDEQGGLIAQLAWSPNDPLENILAAFVEWYGEN